jgi:hypothetical protein
MNSRRVPTTFLATLLFAAAALPAAAQSRPEVTRTSRPVRLIRSWEEPIKGPDGDSSRRVDLVFDYSRGIASQEFFSKDGRYTGRRPILVGLPPPSLEEINEAKGVIRKDPELRRIMDRLAADLTGGFVVEEGRKQPCGPGSRCLLMLMTSQDHTGLVRRMVVDLVKLNIPYRVFEPGPHRMSK